MSDVTFDPGPKIMRKKKNQQEGQHHFVSQKLDFLSPSSLFLCPTAFQTEDFQGNKLFPQGTALSTVSYQVVDKQLSIF